MTRLEEQIAEAVRDERLAISDHADEQLEERNVETWQVIGGFENGRTIDVVPHARPNPKILRRQSLADGTEVIVVWSFDRRFRVAKVVTVYFEGS